MIPAAAIMFFSALGMTALYLRHVPAVAAMTPEELAGILQRHKPLLTDMAERAVRGMRVIWNRYLREKVFAFLVRKISQVRMGMMHIEQKLIRLTRRIHDTSKTNRPPSEYWRDIHGWRKTTHWNKKGK